MREKMSRRDFLAVSSSAIAASALATTGTATLASNASKQHFQLSVLTDEICPDFEKACSIAAREFELKYVELRALWGKNILDLDKARLDKAKQILKNYGLTVTAIAGPLFKVDWPDAPISRFSPTRDKHSADFTFEDQAKVLKHEIELAHMFDTKHIRTFDFWRLDDARPYRKAMNEKLHDAAELASKEGLTLLLENEHACNTGTGAEAAQVMKAIQHPAFKLIWDPGNAFAAGEKSFPDGYGKLPKERIGHVHCKDAERTKGNSEWACVGKGEVGWAGQLEALTKDGYAGPLTLETHWRGAGGEEESTRQSMAGLKTLLQHA